MSTSRTKVVWAKVAGWPLWPAALNKDESEVLFYGEDSMLEVERCREILPCLPETFAAIAKKSFAKLKKESDRTTFRKALRAFEKDRPDIVLAMASTSSNAPRRFPTRRRTSRFVTVDGHTVLRDNNYDLETGIGTFSGTEKQTRLRAIQQPRSAYALFCADARAKILQEKSGEACTLQKLARSWRATSTSTRALYESRARKDRERYETEVREIESACAGEGKRKRRDPVAEDPSSLPTLARIVGVSTRDDDDDDRKKKTKRRRKRTSRRAKKTDDASAHSEKMSRNLALATYNRSVNADLAARKLRRARYLGSNLDALRPFVSDRVARALLSATSPASSSTTTLRSQPDYIVGGTLRDYQLAGLNWLIEMHDRGTNAILADEMGLGKTVQTISFLSYLKRTRGLPGPSLVVVPLSVLTAWMNELKRWAPSMRALRFHSADASERERVKAIFTDEPLSVDVVVTTYEMMVSKNAQHLLSKRVYWRYVVIDEGHKVKNEKTNISKQMALVKSEGRLLLTGTPLQNNLHELWCLLAYLHPDIFGASSSESFDDAFDLTQNKCDRETLAAAHHLLKLFQLRRLKTEVELSMPKRVELKLLVGLSDAQTFWMQKLLVRDARMLARASQRLGGRVVVGDDEDDETLGQAWKRLNNLLMQLRKVCNHPWLMPGARPDDDEEVDVDAIVKASAKMRLLDRLLRELKRRGHRVVIFSQFIGTLNLLEEYMTLREWRYARLDGSTSRVRRALDIRVFNAPKSNVFAYLLSTRAGGLGLNLQTADTVVLFDSDWNPQIDLQAMARVHRIGQTKKVHVYRLVTGGSVEERILSRAEKKLYLDKIVNRDSTRQSAAYEKMDTAEMLKMLRFGANAVFGDGEGVARRIPDAELRRIMDRTVDWKGSKTDDDDDDSAAAESKGGGQRNAADFDVTSAKPLNFRDLLPESTRRQSIRDIGKEWQRVCASKRRRRSRVVRVDGHDVLRENNYVVRGGTYAFAKDADDRGESKTTPTTRGRRRRDVAGRDYDHESFCLICWDGGKLVCCDQCPASYHEACLHAGGYVAVNRVGVGRSATRECFKCPHHACAKCGRGATAAGGLLLRCTECPNCFCEDCEPRERTSLDSGECDRWKALGQTHPRTAFFIQCSPGCRRFHLTRLAKGMEAAIAEQRRLAKRDARAPKSGGGDDDDDDDDEPLPSAAEPPSKATCRARAGDLVRKDGWEWYIARKNDTARSIAARFHLDAARLVYENRCIEGLTVGAKLLRSTPLLLRRAKSSKKETGGIRSETPTSVQMIGGL